MKIPKERKPTIDDKKRYLEQRVLEVLAAAFEKDATNAFTSWDTWGWTERNQLYALSNAASIGHAGIFNNVLSALVKARFIDETEYAVRLIGVRREEVSQKLLAELKFTAAELVFSRGSIALDNLVSGQSFRRMNRPKQ
jgi:hypothetical protein